MGYVDGQDTRQDNRGNTYKRINDIVQKILIQLQAQTKKNKKGQNTAVQVYYDPQTQATK